MFVVCFHHCLAISCYSICEKHWHVLARRCHRAKQQVITKAAMLRLQWRSIQMYAFYFQGTTADTWQSISTLYKRCSATNWQAVVKYFYWQIQWTIKHNRYWLLVATMWMSRSIAQCLNKLPCSTQDAQKVQLVTCRFLWKAQSPAWHCFIAPGNFAVVTKLLTRVNEYMSRKPINIERHIKECRQ